MPHFTTFFPVCQPSKRKTISSSIFYKIFEKWLTKHGLPYYNEIEKGKTSNGYAKNELKDSPDLVGGGYLTFFVSAIKNTIVKDKILNMYFPITTTSPPNHRHRNKVA